MRPLRITSRTVRRASLALLAAVFLIPTAVIVARALYYRSSAYARAVAHRLSEQLGTRVSIGRVERDGPSSSTLHNLAIGNSPETPLITAGKAHVTRDGAGVIQIELRDARLAVRSRRAFTELLALVGGRGRALILLCEQAALDWGLNKEVQGRTVSGSLEFESKGPRGQICVLGSSGDSYECMVRSETMADGRTLVNAYNVPATLLQLAGLAPNLPLGDATVSGTIILSRRESDTSNAEIAPIEIHGVPLGPLLRRWGIHGVAGNGFIRVTGRGWERLDLQKVEAAAGGTAQIAPRALRQLSFLVGVEAADVPDTAGSIQVDRFDFTVTAPKRDQLVLAGGLEPAGTVIRGMVEGDTEPRPLLRLNRTTFTVQELAERLDDIRSGRFDLRPRPVATAPTTTRAASRPAP